MLPVLRREPVLSGVDGAVLTPEELSVLSQDLDAYGTGEMPLCFSSARWAEQLILSICPAEESFGSNSMALPKHSLASVKSTFGTSAQLPSPRYAPFSCSSSY